MEPWLTVSFIMGSNVHRLSKFHMSLSRILLIRNIIVYIVIIRLLGSVMVWPKVILFSGIYFN
jgi:hypothetical protein